MTPKHRPRQLATVGFTAVLVLALAACAQEYPNSTFNHHTEFNLAIDTLFSQLLIWGTLVFVLVEAVLIYTVIRFRRREGQPEPEHVHGNTTLEIIWTVIPAVILVFIAVPTVRTIFRTQARAVPDAMQVEVVGHQWWWEFRYPEYTTANAMGGLDTLTTANELYLPVGRTVNFSLRTRDVLHSFWIPQMGGKRDLISNHTNYIWFTPNDTLPNAVWNGFCAEYCGASHANMKFRAFTVSPQDFEAWVQHQLGGAASGATPAAAPAPAGAAGAQPAAPGQTAPPSDTAVATVAGVPVDPPQPGTAPVQQVSASGYAFPVAELPDYAVPQTPTPRGLTIADEVLARGDATRGQTAYMACVGCHAIRGTPFSVARIGPDLTHIASRTTIGAGLYPNDARHLALWIKNARAMKPGAHMPTLGAGLMDPITRAQVTGGGLSDEQIADIVAYLRTLH